jgi:hypothetical protein
LEGGSGETELALCFEGKGGFCGIACSVFDVVCFIEDDAEKVDGMEEGTFLVNSVRSLEPRVLFPEYTLQYSVYASQTSLRMGGIQVVRTTSYSFISLAVIVRFVP